LVADDGTYLGMISKNPYEGESISNPYGSYGSPYSGTPIFNQYGSYGSPYSSFSPFNPYTSTPPSIIKGKRKVGALTANSYLQNVVDVNQFVSWLKR
jgi:hypothetical protein